jgi:hypothetical protein
LKTAACTILLQQLTFQVGSSVLVSLKVYRDEDENEKCARAIVRLASGTSHRLVYESQVGDSFSPTKVAKFIAPELSVDQFYPVVCPQSSDLVTVQYIPFIKLF